MDLAVVELISVWLLSFAVVIYTGNFRLLSLLEQRE